MHSVNMLDLASEYELFADELRATVHAVLDSQQFVGGPAIGQLEETLAARVHARHAIAVSSGTDALLVALMALNIGPGDEVILPALTFFATAGSVARLGAAPIFVDVDPDTFNIDPKAIEAAITDKTKAIIAVHLYGQCADMDGINRIAAARDITVIEDAAQAIGAAYFDRPACSLGTIACVSFYPTKNLGGFGEGGMVFTSDESLALTVRQLRNHGETGRYVHAQIGGNFRLDTLKAAILLLKAQYLDRFNERRRANAAAYDELLSIANVQTPTVAAGCHHVYHQYTIQCDRRDTLKSFLADRGIGSAVYYPIPLHLQECFLKRSGKPGSLPVTEALCGKVLSLPCHPMLSDADRQRVASGVKEFSASPKPADAKTNAAVG